MYQFMNKNFQYELNFKPFFYSVCAKGVYVCKKISDLIFWIEYSKKYISTLKRSNFDYLFILFNN